MNRYLNGGSLARICMMVVVTMTLTDSTSADQGGNTQTPDDHFVVPEVTSSRTEHVVDVGGRRLHGFTYGRGVPTVVLLSGFNAPQEYWNVLISPLAEKATVLTYDRAGIGKSELGELPAHGRQSATDLHRLLESIDVPKPVLLVGHSYGVRIARIYASMFPDDIGCLVLLDGQHPGILDAQRRVIDGKDLERLERMTAGRNRRDDLKTEMDYIWVSMEQDLQISALPKVPCVVVGAGAGRARGIPPGFSDEAREKMVAVGLEYQQKLAAEIPGCSYIMLKDLGHVMHLEDPEPVLKIIADMIAEVVQDLEDQ